MAPGGSFATSLGGSGSGATQTEMTLITAADSTDADGMGDSLVTDFGTDNYRDLKLRHFAQ